MALPIVLALARLIASGADQAPTSWPLTEQLEVRFECHPAVTPEQKAKGWTPHWEAKAIEDDGAPVLSIGGDDNGACTGYFYVGRRVQLPERIPPCAVVRLAYQRECKAHNRAPPLWLHVFTVHGWDRMSPTAEEAKPKGRHGSRARLRTATIASGQDDTFTWTDWESPNLSLSLRRECGHEVVIAFGMAGMHASGAEWAKLKAPALVLTTGKAEAASRTPKYPPKQQRTLHRDEEVALARRRCEEDAGARAIRNSLASACRVWLEMSDEALRAYIPSADVPRAGNVCTQGCPVHGKQVYRGGCYPWRLKRDEPFKIFCPIGGEAYPSNDFWAYYRSGFKDRESLKGQYVDDGWGWKGPSGEIYWFVAYACHWHWHRYILSGALNLSRAYLLTGDARYAHKAAVMLDRIAEEYPSMQYEHQSRYSFETGGNYRGKILNLIWETFTVRRLAEAYDNVFDALKDGSPLEGQLGRPCKAVRDNVEANILEEAIERVQDGAIRGNFGMHQCALTMAVIVREKGPTQELLDWMLRRSGQGGFAHEGVEYAFCNFVHKDGMPYETSPGYSFGWVANFVSLARMLDKTGYDLYRQPKFKAMLDMFLDLVCVGKYTPAIGDAGSIKSGWIGGSIPVYRAGFARYRDVRYAHALEKLGAFRTKTFADYESLFEPTVIEQAKQAAAQQPKRAPRSRVRDGYGIAILNNASDSVAVSIYYGARGSHCHLDRLNFSLFAHGQKMTPDLGYPDFMNALIPGIFSWSTNTVSHNCVVVNARRQPQNVAGRVRAFLDAPGVRFIDVSADETYEETSVYRRALLLVDLGPESAYLLDMFTVSGGGQHDYSLHGPLGELKVLNADVSPPQTEGTLAGENVPYGHFYDDPVLGEPEYRGSYGRYRGSGFQHLENVQRLAPGKWWAQWRLDGAEDVGLRMRLLDQPGQELFVCDGRVSPTGKNPWVLKYFIARHRGKDLRSKYVALLEPFRGEPQVADVRRLDVQGDASESCYAVEVQRRGGVDVVLYQLDPQAAAIPAADVETDAALCVVRLDADRDFRSAYVLNGTYARVGQRRVSMRGPYTGTIAAVDDDARSVTLRLTDGHALPTDDTLRGRPIIFPNPKHSSFYTIRSVRREGDGYVVALAEPDIMRGRAQAGEVCEKQIRTRTPLPFRTVYAGTRAVNEAKTVSVPVESVGGGAIHLAQPCRATDFTDADGDGVTDAWLCDLGPGDAFRIDSVTVIQRHG